MVEGIYERFWQQTIESFITTRTLKTKVLLTRNEFVNLDISKFYTLLGQRFILNKVSDFDPMLDEQMVDVELLQYLPMRGSDVVEVAASTLTAISGSGTQQNIITGTNDSNINGRGVELKRGRYVYIIAQAGNADNQTMTAIGISQSDRS